MASLCRDNFLAKVKGHCPAHASANTNAPYCRAVSFNLSVHDHESKYRQNHHNMKTKTLFLILITAISIGTVWGQKVEQSTKSKWSLTIGYAPDYDFNLSNQVPSEGDVWYMFGFIVRANFKLADKFSLSVGLYPRKREEDYLFMPSDTWNPNFLDAHETRFFLEFPLQINYFLNITEKSLKPYLRLAIRNAYYNRKLIGEDQNGPFSINDKQYNLLSDLGIGSNLKIVKNLSLVTELCFGYCFIYDFSNRGYIDGLIGLQYNF